MTTIRPRLASLIALGLAVLAFACGGDGVVLPNEAKPAFLTRVSGDSQSAAAGQALELPLIVRVADALDRPVEGQVVAFAVGTSGGRVTPASATTDADGKASVTWTLGGAAGQQKVRASVTGDGVPDGLLVDFSATAVSGAGANIVLVSGDGQTAPASTALPDSLVVRVTDALANPVAGVMVNWDVGGGGSISPGSVTTDASGLASAQRVLGNSAGTETATASSTGLTPVTFTHTATPPPTNRLVFLTGPADRVVGEKFSPGLQVQVQDPGGNPVVAATAPITITPSVTGTLSGTATAVPILGTATFTNLAINKAGTGYTLTALASEVSSVTSVPFDVNQASTTIAITTKSPGGNSVFGQAVTFNYDVNIVSPGAGSLTGSVTVSDGTDSCTGGITAGGGTGSCQITFGSTGPRTVTAVYSGDANFVGSTSAPVNHTVSKASTQLTITSDDPEPSDPNQTVTVNWTLSPTGAGAGTPTGTVTVGGGAGVTPCSVPAAFGTSSCDLVFPTSGNKTITASYSGDANFNASSDNEPHTVTTPNVPPTATDDAFSTNEDVGLTVNASNGVLKNDNDPDKGPQTLQARNFSTPAHGTLVGQSDGSFTYTPAADFNGSDSFTYEAFDGAASAQATVTITINPVNDAPSFTSGGDVTVSLAAGPVSQAWATNGSPGPANESGQTLAYQVSFDPDFLFGPEFFTVPPSISPDGTLSFTPGFIGVAHMIVHVQDNGGTQNGGIDTSADQKFTITIND